MLNAEGTNRTVKVWQWNCRGYKRKRPALQLLVQSQGNPPDIIALQETNTHARLAGYKAFQSQHYPQTAVLVNRNLTAAHQQFDSVDIPHDLITVYPKKRSDPKIFILNVYSSPKHRKDRFNRLFSLTRKEAGPHALIIVGDFNAPHAAWGYKKSSVKGTDLWDQAQQHHLNILNDANTVTRVGNSAQADTSPDLTFTLHTKEENWNNTGHTLGSDHYIIETVIAHTGRIKYVPRQQTLTEWDDFRTLRGSKVEDSQITDIENWTAQLLSDIKTVTKQIDTDITSLTVQARPSLGSLSKYPNTLEKE